MRRTARRTLSRTLVTAALLAAPLLAAAVPFEVQVYDRTDGRVLPTYEFQGRTYVVGRPGNEYALTLRNQAGERVLAVGSVDGVNIITGETASAQQSGYVLSPGQSAEINGWRKSMSRTAAFFFTEHDNSYAARTGRPNDVGVIGVALFRERVPQPPVAPPSRPPWRWREAPAQGMQEGARDDAPRAAAPAAPAPSTAGSALADSSAKRAERTEKSLGTGHGRSEQSETRYTDFQRISNTPEQVITIYYDTYSNLLAQGVPVWRDGDRYAYRRPQPRAFPRDPGAGFVPDPR